MSDSEDESKSSAASSDFDKPNPPRKSVSSKKKKKHTIRESLGLSKNKKTKGELEDSDRSLADAVDSNLTISGSPSSDKDDTDLDDLVKCIPEKQPVVSEDGGTNSAMTGAIVFKCAATARYSIPKEYVFYKDEGFGEKSLFNCKKAYDNIEKFSVLLTQDNIDHTPLYQSPTNCQLKRHVVFIPSFGRSRNVVLLDTCDNSKKEIYFVLVVCHLELNKYTENYRSKASVIGIPFTGIGATRNWILKQAKNWKLHRCWMLDDNIDCKTLGRRAPGSFSDDRTGDELLTLSKMFDELSSILEVEEKLCIIGPASDLSSHGVDLTKTEPKTNERAPTSFVLINVDLCLKNGINYHPNLSSKEDILFAYSCLCHNLDICVHRLYYFNKKSTSGGNYTRMF